MRKHRIQSLHTESEALKCIANTKLDALRKVLCRSHDLRKKERVFPYGISKTEIFKRYCTGIPRAGGFPISQVAKYHSYARTRSYKHPEVGSDYSVYREMHKNPIDDRWFIREVWLRPNGKKTKPERSDLLVEGKKVSSKTDLSFPQALHELAKFERENESMRFALDDQRNDQEKNELSKFYFEKIAVDENIMLDQRGEPHPVVDGRHITDGVFDASKLQALQVANENRKDLRVQPLSQIALSQIFSTKSQDRDVLAGLDYLERLREERDLLFDLCNGFKFMLVLQNLISGNNDSEANLKGAFDISTTISRKLKNMSINLKDKGELECGLDGEHISTLLDKMHFINSIVLASKAYERLMANKASSSFKQYRIIFESLREKAKEAMEIAGADEMQMKQLDQFIVNPEEVMVLKDPEISDLNDKSSDENIAKERLRQKLSPFIQWENGCDLHLWYMQEEIVDYMQAVRETYEKISAALDGESDYTKMSTSQLQKIEGKGHHLGKWKPEGLSKTFNVYVNPDYLKAGNFSEARDKLAKKNGLKTTRVKANDFVCEDNLLRILKDGGYDDEWVLPPYELMRPSGHISDHADLYAEMDVLPLERDNRYWTSSFKNGSVYFYCPDNEHGWNNNLCEKSSKKFILPFRFEEEPKQQEQEFKQSPEALPG